MDGGVGGGDDHHNFGLTRERSWVGELAGAYTVSSLPFKPSSSRPLDSHRVYTVATAAAPAGYSSSQAAAAVAAADRPTACLFNVLYATSSWESARWLLLLSLSLFPSRMYFMFSACVHVQAFMRLYTHGRTDCRHTSARSVKEVADEWRFPLPPFTYSCYQLILFHLRLISTGEEKK